MEEKPDMFSEVPEGAATLVVELCSALARGFYTAYPLFAMRVTVVEAVGEEPLAQQDVCARHQ
jgi:hypothetical protein